MERFRVTPTDNAVRYTRHSATVRDCDQPLNGTQLEHLVTVSTSACEARLFSCTKQRTYDSNQTDDSLGAAIKGGVCRSQSLCRQKHVVKLKETGVAINASENGSTILHVKLRVPELWSTRIGYICQALWVVQRIFPEETGTTGQPPRRY
ncbi:hypothetical protein DMN91_006672 [Ooceraea biroi]|uniref:Uncharacterized protein n=1 Tax=Ooceraea biroi TaxID=2015173 RepID=A0A3L8DIB3_OOCBI|nr:hypothetical protein DMN91_006672 [Ooceraea biroi]